MTQRQVIMQRYHGIAPDSEVCGNCEHFIQHYNINPFWSQQGKFFIPMHCGHCTYPRLKNRTVHDSCDKFAPAYKYEGVGELSDDELEFLDKFRMIPDVAKGAIIRVLASSAAEREIREADGREKKAKVKPRGEIIQLPKVKE